MALFISKSIKYNMGLDGVALFILKSIKYNMFFRSDFHGEAESLFAELLIGRRKVLVGVVYLPHGGFQSFEQDVSDLLVSCCCDNGRFQCRYF